MRRSKLEMYVDILNVFGTKRTTESIANYVRDKPQLQYSKETLGLSDQTRTN
jgi:hypothetical protein